MELTGTDARPWRERVARPEYGRPATVGALVEPGTPGGRFAVVVGYLGRAGGAERRQEDADLDHGIDQLDLIADFEVKLGEDGPRRLLP